MSDFQVGDVVQIVPESDDRFGACFMTITDVKEWGAQGYVRIPGGGEAYYRAYNKNMEFIGHAVFRRSE